MYWKDPQLHVLHRDLHITVCDHTLFTIAKFWRQHWCSTIEEWIRKHTEICVCRKKMDAIGEKPAKQMKPFLEGQIAHVVCCLWFLN